MRKGYWEAWIIKDVEKIDKMNKSEFNRFNERLYNDLMNGYKKGIIGNNVWEFHVERIVLNSKKIWFDELRGYTQAHIIELLVEGYTNGEITEN